MFLCSIDKLVGSNELMSAVLRSESPSAVLYCNAFLIATSSLNKCWWTAWICWIGNKSGSGIFLVCKYLVKFFSFIFSLADQFLNLLNLILLAILVSFFCQVGDLFISYLKRKAKVKDTGDILPGHGGLLDRIDGMILAIPIGVLILEFLILWKKKLPF